jgi:hypothetical protein
MKTILLTASFIALASGAYAQDFKSTYGRLSLEQGSFDLVIDTNANRVSSVEAGVTLSPHTLGDVQGNFRLSLGTIRNNTSDVYIQGAHNLSLAITDTVTLYSTNALRYYRGGTWQYKPSVGLSASINSSVGVFTEVNHTWQYKSGVNSIGGELSVGADILATKNLTIRPAIVRSFNSAANNTNARIEAILRF